MPEKKLLLRQSVAADGGVLLNELTMEKSKLLQRHRTYLSSQLNDEKGN